MGPLSGNDPHEKTEFWYQLARRPAVSNDEAFHALLLYFGGADPAADYPGRMAALKKQGMLPARFDHPADEMAARGVIALAIARGAGIKGGITMQVLGANERYADRALQYRRLLPAGSPNQVLSGGQFVAVIGRLEDYQRGNPNEAPAALLPGEVSHPAGLSMMPVDLPDLDQAPTTSGEADHPLMLSVLTLNTWSQETRQVDGGVPATTSQPAATRDKPVKLKVIITGVEGDQAEIRKSPADAWMTARVGQSLNEGGEFRTGPRSAVRFVIPPDQVFTLDRQGTCTVLQAVYDGKKVSSDVGMQQGRVRLDVARIAKPLPKPTDSAESRYEFEQSGIEHGITIRSPNAALAVRGTLVSLYDEPGFMPEAVSLTGQAAFRNTRGQFVAFGGAAGRTTIRGDQSSAAQQASAVATLPPNSEVARNDFDARQTALLLDRGGLLRGDVLTGNSRVTDAQLVPKLPGALDFVLRWDGGPQRSLNDLNLVVFSPIHSAQAPDFVGNPPFTISLEPGDPQAEKTRAMFYPRSSRSGGQISKNHVGPEGLEFASWSKNYPPGDYRVVVFNLLDAVPPPPTMVNPVNYTVDVFLNKRVLINTVTGSVGELQTSVPLVVPVPPNRGATASVAATSPKATGPTNGGQTERIRH